MPTKVVILISRRRVGRATTLRRQIADPLSGNLNRVDESALFVHLPPQLPAPGSRGPSPVECPSG